MTDQQARVLAVLQAGGTPSTKEIEDRAQVASARDYITRLRKKGHRIERLPDEWVNGARICRYKLHPPAPVTSGEALLNKIDVMSMLDEKAKALGVSRDLFGGEKG